MSGLGERVCAHAIHTLAHTHSHKLYWHTHAHTYSIGKGGMRETAKDSNHIIFLPNTLKCPVLVTVDPAPYKKANKSYMPF